ncbi:MAG: RIP metalloprotease RseP, partial [Chromatiales bacterium]|nr:RIP metalloprotease RseP [Chromatiales bacterium]
MSTFTYIVSFIVAIGVLVTVHEYGHFWVARRLGIKVLRFSIGFGKALWSRRAKDGTEYVLAAIPLGGYVKMLDEREGAVAPEMAHQAFNRQPLWIRYAVVGAGPAANFLFAIAAYWLMFMIGVVGMKPIIGEVHSGSAAELAGVRSEHTIVAVDGVTTPSWSAARHRILAGLLETDALPIDLTDVDGRRQTVVLDLSNIALDDLTEGRFHSGLGMEPLRVKVPAVIGFIEPDSAAEAMGLQPGDKVVE